MLQYTPLEPSPGPLWVDVDRRGAAPEADEADGDKPGGDGGGMVEGKRREKRVRGGERMKPDEKRKDCFALGNPGGSSSESEVEQHDRQRHIDQWNPKLPDIMEVHPEAAKRHRNT